MSRKISTDTFTTTNHNDFNWPHSRPLMIVPSQPPKNNNSNLYLPRPDTDECGCNIHSYKTDLSRYKELAKQESQLRDDIMKVNSEMVGLMSRMLNSCCKSEEETMNSVYKETHQQSSGAPITQYRSLIAAVDSPKESPTKSTTTKELKEGYRNPNMFRHSTIETSRIAPAESIDLSREPELFITWNKPFMGRSEYMDTIGKSGVNNLKNLKQYIEPIPSSRRRWTY